jgi:SAM-dependent methyltransferase
LHGLWLDCGCANGGYTRGLAEKGAARAIGLDVEFRRVRKASGGPLTEGQVCFLNATTEALPFRAACFEGVLLNEVLEHVEDEVQTLEQIFRIIRPGGTFALMSPNRLFPFEGHGLVIGRVRLPYPVPLVPWLPARLTRRFSSARNYWPGELRRLVEFVGFEVLFTRSLMPLFEIYPWLPQAARRAYRKGVPALEKLPLLRNCGVSTFILARRPV